MGFPLKWLGTIGKKALQGAKIIAAHPDAMDAGEAWLRNHGASTGIIGGLDVLEEIASKIVDVEIVGQSSGLTGAQKAAAASKLVAQALLKSRILGGKAPADEALFLKGCESIASGVADVLNSRQPEA